MANLFNDTFAGASGTLGGHAPDTPIAALTWASTTMMLDGAGFVRPTDNSNRYTHGNATYGDLATGRGLANAFTIKFTVKTGPDVTADGNDYGFLVTVLANGRTYNLNIGSSGSEWMAFVSVAGYSDNTIVYPTISPNTEYAVVANITLSEVNMTFAGSTSSLVVSALNPGLGLTGFALQLGGASSVKGLSALVQEAAIGTASLVLPTPTIIAFTRLSTSALAAPVAGVIAYGGGGASIAMSSPATSAAGHDSTGENTFAFTLPAPTLAAYFGAGATLMLRAPTLGFTATVTNLGTSMLTAPASRISASGTISGTAQASLTSPMAALIGYGGAVCSVTLTGKCKVQASGTTGSIGVASLACPLFELISSGTAQNYGNARLLAPAARLGATAQVWLIAPGATLTAIGSATVVAAYEAYAINLNHNDPAANDEVTRYTNFPFTQIVRYQGSYFGVAADGLYLLEGTTDDGEVIPWTFKTAMTDFKSPFRKTVVSAYFGGRLGPAATIDLHVGEDGATTYNYSTVRSDHAQCYRQKFGRGLTAHYYALGVAGTGTLELDSIEFDTLNSNRRI